jgi:hypothetical protein
VLRLNLNEAEKYLVANWESAMKLEAAMEAVRAKYSQIADEIIRVVQEEHPELDASYNYVHRSVNGGGVGLGRKAWPADQAGRWFTGYYIEGLGLDGLLSPTETRPNAFIWMSPVKANHALQQAILDDAKSRLTKEQLARCTGKSLGDVNFLKYELPEKEELPKMLLEGDVQGFVDHVASHFKVLTTFTPVIDKFLVHRGAT